MSAETISTSASTHPWLAQMARSRAERRAETRRTRGLLLGQSKVATVVAFAILAFLAASWLLPLAWAIDTSLKTENQAQSLPLRWFPEGGFTLENYRVVFERGEVFTWMGNTFLIAAAVTVLTVIICALAGYAFSRTVFAGRRVLFLLTIALIMVPGQILIVPLFKEMDALNLVDTFAGVILPQTIAPMMVYIFKQYFDQVPQEVEDAARVDGAGNWRLFWNVILPISRPIVTAVAIFVFIGAWNNFMWPFIVTNNPDLMTLPVGLSTVKNAYGIIYAQTMASAMIAALPLTLLFMVFQRQIIKAVATTGLGGQ
ncbi:MAG: carbohydrate ABC transporter permease [Actinomyces urogenitalis]|nr:carbohydrate ABC transporter permease [Actinomyces urogenitalis]